jgi:hypothetical protein
MDRYIMTSSTISSVNDNERMDPTRPRADRHAALAGLLRDVEQLGRLGVRGSRGGASA